MDINKIPVSDVGKGSRIRLEICEQEVDLYWKIALEVLETVDGNNRAGEPTVMVVPYGPVGPYERLACLVNRYRISLRNCIFINMDEYLTPTLHYLNKEDPLSFRGGMERQFYSLVEEELNVPQEQRIFPEPGREEHIQEIIDRYGKLDMAFGGVGINGHLAFNEPPEEGENVTAEEFRERPTRILRIARETRTINAFMNCGGDLTGIPENCITVGMKEIWQAKKIRMCMPRDWNAGALRKILHGPATPQVPCSLFQNHPDAALLAIRSALESPAPAIRVYNK